MKKFPHTRPRRNRLDDWGRRLTAENTLSTNDLILPLFILDGVKKKEEVQSMPGVFRYSLDNLLLEIEGIVKKNIPLIALFPNIEQNLKTTSGSEALNSSGIVPRAISAIKKEFPEPAKLPVTAESPVTAGSPATAGSPVTAKLHRNGRLSSNSRVAVTAKLLSNSRVARTSRVASNSRVTSNNRAASNSKAAKY